MFHKVIPLVAAIIISLSVFGCVSKNAFEMMEEEANGLERELQDLQARYITLKDAKAEMFNQNEILEREKVELVTDNQKLTLILRAKADELSQIISDLRFELSDLKEEHKLLIQTYEKKVANLTKLNGDLQNEVEQLRLAKEKEVKEMSSTYEELLSKMKNEVEKGQVTISELKGKLTVNLVDAILFDSGRTEVKDEGLLVLQKVVDILKTVTDKAIRVEGHTDNVKIGAVLARIFPTNWELSSRRAVNVTKFLQAQGLDPKNLSAVAYGEYSPVADNETDEGKAQNRRIEIVLIAKDR